MLPSRDVLNQIIHHRLIDVVICQIVLLLADDLLLAEDYYVGDEDYHGENEMRGIYMIVLNVLYLRSPSSSMIIRKTCITRYLDKNLPLIN